MHLFVFFRGLNHYIDLYKSLIESQFWKWKRINLETGKEEISLVQGALRESYFGCYEYIFPEEALPEVLKIFGITKTQAYGMRFNTIRKMFGLKKVPNWAWKEAEKINPDVLLDDYQRGLTGVRVPGCGMNLIGIKYDKRGEIYGYNQEWL